MIIDHFTIHVSDHARSTRFYCEGLGFEHIGDQTVGNDGAGPALVEGDFRVHSRFLRGGGVTLILNQVEISSEPLAPYRRQMGLTNFAFRVDDLVASAERLRALGGTPIESSRASFPTDGRTVDVIVVLDPDGQPIELIQ